MEVFTIFGVPVPKDVAIKFILDNFDTEKPAESMNEIIDFMDMEPEHVELVSEKLGLDFVLMLTRIRTQYRPNFERACQRFLNRVKWSEDVKALFEFGIFSEDFGSIPVAPFLHILASRPEFVTAFGSDTQRYLVNIAFCTYGSASDWAKVLAANPRLASFCEDRGRMRDLWYHIARSDNVEALKVFWPYLAQLSEFLKTRTVRTCVHLGALRCIDFINQVDRERLLRPDMLEIAIESDEFKCVELILSLMGKDFVPNSRLIEEAIDNSTPKIVQLLAERVPVISLDSIEEAARRGHVGILTYLLSRPHEHPDMWSLVEYADTPNMLQFFKDKVPLYRIVDVIIPLFDRLPMQRLTALLRIVMNDLDNEHKLRLAHEAIVQNRLDLLWYFLSYGIVVLDKGDDSLLDIALRQHANFDIVQMLVRASKNATECAYIALARDRIDLVEWIVLNQKLDMFDLAAKIVHEDFDLSPVQLQRLTMLGFQVTVEVVEEAARANAEYFLESVDVSWVDFAKMLQLAIENDSFGAAHALLMQCKDNVLKDNLYSELARALVKNYDSDLFVTDELTDIPYVLRTAVMANNIDVVRDLLKRYEYSVAYLEGTLLPLASGRVAFLLEEYVITHRTEEESKKKRAKFTEKRKN